MTNTRNQSERVAVATKKGSASQNPRKLPSGKETYKLWAKGELAESDDKAAQHHASCRPSDKDLVWHCAQCGLNESAEDTAAELERAKQQLDTAQMYLESAEAQRDKAEQLNSELLLKFQAIWDAWHVVPFDNDAMTKAIRAMHTITPGRTS